MAKRRKNKKPVGIKARLSFVLSAFSGIAFSAIGAFLLFCVFAGLMVILGYSLSDILVLNTLFIQLAYFVSFYFIYSGRIVSRGSDGGVSLRRSLLGFFRGRGSAYIALSLVLAVANETALLISAPESTLFSLALATVFPLVGSVKIIILRSVLNYIVLLLGSLCAVLIKAFFVKTTENRAKMQKNQPK